MTLRWILGALVAVASTFVAADAARAQVCDELDVAEPMSSAIYGTLTTS